MIKIGKEIRRGDLKMFIPFFWPNLAPAWALTAKWTFFFIVSLF